MIAPKVGVAARPHRVTLQAPGDPVPDGDGGYTQGWEDLIPPALSMAIQPASAQMLERLGQATASATATHVITGPFHPGVTTKTRLMFGAREFHVNGIANIEERGVEMVLVCTANPVSNTLIFEGLAELKQALLDLPRELRDEASGIVGEEASAAAEEIVAAYPEREGDLKDGVEVRSARTEEFATAAMVINTAKHATWIEEGTQARRYGDQARGSMPARHIFVPRIIKHRARMYARLADMIRRHGLEVSGTEGGRGA